MENNNQIITGILEDQGLDQNQIAEIMGEISQINMGEIDPSTPPGGVGTFALENDLRQQLSLETDWRRKASLAARIISLGLE